ncbi:MAG: hypothetical protein ACJA0E_001238 [Bermanella sp.]|jgi:hypothetical protein
MFQSNYNKPFESNSDVSCQILIKQTGPFRLIQAVFQMIITIAQTGGLL